MFGQMACRNYQKGPLLRNAFKHSLRSLTCMDNALKTDQMRTSVFQENARRLYLGNVLHSSKRPSSKLFVRDTYRDDIASRKVPQNPTPDAEDDNSIVTSAILQMRDRIRTNPMVPIAEWKLLEDEVEGNDRLRRSWEFICMGWICHGKSLDGALLFLDYIRGQGRKPNIPTLACLIDLCAEVGGEQDLIFATYDELLTLTDVFDTPIAKTLIRGFAATDAWKKCFEFLEMVKYLQKPSSSCYSPIVRAALREGDFQMANSLIETMGKEGLLPYSDVFLKYLEVCSTNDSEITVAKLFEYLRLYQWFITADVANAIHEMLLTNASNETKQWSSHWAVVNKKGLCTHCRKTMNKVSFSDSEFKQLQDVFKNKVLLGENVYLKSSPEEVNRLISLVKDSGPFDICIDALNLKTSVLDAVRYFHLKKRKRVLVIGREHLLKSRWQDMRIVMKYSKCFFTENISKDDPFTLYATLFSGPHAMFVSQDEMRDHKSLLEEYGELFQRWQRCRQIYPAHNGFWMPNTHDTFAQRSLNGWHIPYDDGTPRFSYQHSNKWLCIQKK